MFDPEESLEERRKKSVAGRIFGSARDAVYTTLPGLKPAPQISATPVPGAQAGPMSRPVQPFSKPEPQQQLPVQPLFRGLDGERITSTYRDPNKNKAVGGVTNSFHTRKDQYGRALGRDSVPPPGMGMAEYARKLQQLNPGMQVINEGDHVHMEPQDGNIPASSALPAFQNPFDPQYHNAAMAQVDKAEQLALQPFSVDVQMPDMPEMPGPPEQATMDFSAQEAALEEMRPQIMSEKEGSAIARRNLIGGIAQAMGNLQDGASLGKVLSQLGAGALAGRAAGGAEIQARMDAFDEKMAKFKALEFQFAGAKSEQQYKEAAQEAASMYQYNADKFNYELQKFQAGNAMDIQGNNVIIRKTENGKTTISTVPIEPAIKSAFALQRASALQGLGNQAMQGNAMVASATNQFIAGTVLQQMQNQNGPMRPEEALVNSGQMMATEIVTSGIGQRLFGQEYYSALTEASREQAMREGYTPGDTKSQERIQQILSGMIFMDALQEPEVMQKLQSASPLLQESFVARRLIEGTTTYRSQQGGQTVTQRR